MNKKYIERLAKKFSCWCKFSSAEVLVKFGQLNGSWTQGNGDVGFCYIAADNPDNAALVVAHVDTDLNNEETKIDIVTNEKILKCNQNTCFANRAACAMLWELQHIRKHSLMVVTGPRGAYNGESWIMDNSEIESIINGHNLVIKLDYHGTRQFTLFDNDDGSLIDYVSKETGFDHRKDNKGFVSNRLCDEINGVNMSVGVVQDRLYVDEWNKTLITLDKMLRKDIDKYPIMTLVADKQQQTHFSYEEYKKKLREEERSSNKPVIYSSTKPPPWAQMGSVICMECSEIWNSEIVRKNEYHCPKCQSAIKF